MTVKPDKIRKLVTLPLDLWREIEEYRWERRLKTESEALRMLLTAGIAASKASKAKKR
jgi:hypothetical protein